MMARACTLLLLLLSIPACVVASKHAPTGVHLSLGTNEDGKGGHHFSPRSLVYLVLQ